MAFKEKTAPGPGKGNRHVARSYPVATFDPETERYVQRGDMGSKQPKKKYARKVA